MPAEIQRIEMDQLACWRIRRGDAELLVAEQGAQVLSYRRGDQPPIIWLSEEAAFIKGQPVRGGIPVCWPWFGDLARNPEPIRAQYQADSPAPAHGLVRSLDWTLGSKNSQADSATLIFSCNLPDSGLPGWPHALDLRLEIRLDEALHLRLTTRNRSDMPVTLSQALHSYFAVSDIHQVAVQGLASRRYIETLQGWEEHQQQGDLTFTGETDRIYLGLPPSLSLIDLAWNRRIDLSTDSSSSAVLWNPWIDKSKRLSQFAENAWQRMACIETANVLDDHVRLLPQESHALSVSIREQPLHA